IFVGEVRSAITGLGSSWKLSGGSQFSCALTKVSKKCHVLRALTRKNPSCSADKFAGTRAIGWLIHHAIHGETNHRQKTGKAAASSVGCMTARNIADASAVTGATHILAKQPARSWREPSSE